MQFVQRAVQMLVFLFLISCGGSDDSDPPQTTFDGSRPSLSEFYSESQLVATESLGFLLNFGDDPPDVEGSFRIDPVVLQASSISDDAFGVGNTDVPFNLTFSDQDENSLTIDVDMGTDLIEVTSAVISGSGNAFTVFAMTLVPAISEESRMALSGNLTEFGIENFQYAPFVVGSEDIRPFEDQDNLSERL